ncbi:MAG: hypothetical protein HQL75_04405 [Magnetococcales bacterium]|nr:hypothetical protein [Magnetococcales bacterium]
MAAGSLFKLYGEWVDGLFALESGDNTDPFAVVDDTSDAIAEPLPQNDLTHPALAQTDHCCSGLAFKKTLSEVISPKDREKIAGVIHHYRQKLSEEASQATTTGKPVGLALKTFRNHLHSGREEGLEDNPFYKIVLTVFHAARIGLFRSLSGQVLEQMPQPPTRIRLTPTIREVWRRPRAFGGFFFNLGAILQSQAILLRNPISVLLFIGIAYAVSLAANYFLQSPIPGEYLPDIQGLSGESKRYLIATLMGVACSTVVLDFKNRLFQAIAESGKVFTGIRKAFLRNPRWMTVALLCALTTIKASNDALITFLTGQQTMAAQVQAIEEAVYSVLGTATAACPPEPDSLFNFQAILSHDIDAQVEKLEQLPNRDLRKNPHFWAEHFIIYGGYEPGVSDVDISNATPLSKTLDAMLAGSGIDFSSSFREKSRLLLETCRKQWVQTQEEVREQLAQRHRVMGFKNQSWLGFGRFSLAESYSTNNLVATMRTKLENTQTTCQQIVEDFADLTHSYLEILRQVNPSTNINTNDLTIGTSVEPFTNKAIDALDPAKITPTERPNLVKFATMLGAQYGPVMGPLLFALFLILAIGMVFGDLVLFAHIVGQNGRRDQALVPSHLAELKAWETTLIDLIVENISSNWAQCLLGCHIQFNKIAVELQFYKQIEKNDPETKYIRDRNMMEVILLWFRSMLTPNRPLWTRMFNVRLAAINRLIRPETSTFSDWFHRCYFGPMSHRTLWRSSLSAISGHIVENNESIKKEIDQIFFRRQDRTRHPLKVSAGEEHTTLLDRITLFFNRFCLVITRAFGDRTIFCLRGSKTDPDWFPLTFHHWRLKFSDRLDQYSKLKDRVLRIQPEIHAIYEKSVSSVYADILYPIIEIKKRYGEHLTSDWNRRFTHFESKLNDFERKILETLGVLPLMVAATSSRELVEILEYIESVIKLDTEIIMDVLNFIDSGSLFSDVENENTGQKLKNEGRKLLEEANTQLAKVWEQEKMQWKEIEGIADLLDERLVEVRKIFNKISEIFLHIRQKESDFITRGYPSQIARTHHRLNQTLVNMAPREADHILERMESILTAKHPYTSENLTTVEMLKRDAKALYDRLDSYVSSIHTA